MNTPEQTPSSPPPAASNDNVKLTLILAYVLWLVGLILHYQKKTAITAFHLRQVLGLAIACIAAGIVMSIISLILGAISAGLALAVCGLFGFALSIGCFVCWLMGLLSALKLEEKPMPVIGPYTEKFLGKLFN